MRYAVISPKNELICFDHSEQVAEYCLEKDNEALNEYCKDQEYVYETLTPTEIGQLYTEIGATHGGCRVFETSQVIKFMKENGVGEELIEKARDIFNDRRLNNEVDCPGFLEDFFVELTPLHPAQFTDGIYFMENIDASDETPDRG